ncbi:MAG: DnaJ domain-containing protein [Clostridia bacterium]|nr:DnaJ domain-containing protein [Clostridia bacterium]
MTEFHRTLNVPDNASEAEIRCAYRTLARKWHPDRFQEGPERAWAEKQMIEINQAYNQLIRRCKLAPPASPMERFKEVRLLIEAGQLSRARQLMCAMDERSAEWNYHFGQMLLKRNDYEKAAVYLKIAVRQAPDNQEYKRVLEKAEAYLNKTRLGGVLKKIRSLHFPKKLKRPDTKKDE